MKRTLFKLTRKELSKLFIYDREAGKLLARQDSHKGRWKKGREVGSKDKYSKVNVNGQMILRYRIIYLLVKGYVPKEIDHINRNSQIDRIENLRAATHSNNAANSIRKKNSTGYKGVHFCKSTGKYRAQIKKNYKKFHLGRYVTAKEAAIAYNKAALKLFGKFACLNKV